MRDIMRSYIHTLITCNVADLKTGKIKKENITLKNRYNNEKHMITKLEHKLEAEDKRLIQVLDYHRIRVSYYMKEETFLKHHDYNIVHDDYNKETKNKKQKEKEKQKND